MSDEFKVGYGRGEIEPRIAPLVKAVQKAGFETFSSCEGHLEDEGAEIPRQPSVGFYASEDEARRVHGAWLQNREELACSWALRANFVGHRRTQAWVLGWTLENWGVKAAESSWKDTVLATWEIDVPKLVAMFEELGSGGS